MIDPSARIDPTATVGPDAHVGADTVIGRDVHIDDGVVVGARVQIEIGALLYRGAEIADGVYVGPGAILTNDRYPRAVTSTADLSAAAAAATPCHLDEGCSVGAGAIVVAGVTVGAWATVGAGAVVTRDVPSHALVVGSPARRIGWVCECGARLVDSNGDPMAAEPGRYATHQELICQTCGRTYAYIADAETLEERTGPKVGRPA